MAESAPRRQKAWELPWSHRDPIVGVEVEVDRYDLDSGGVGIQVTLKGSISPVAVRVPMERAVGLAMKIIAESYETRESREREVGGLARVQGWFAESAEPECQCDLIDTSVLGGEPSYVRGAANGCLRHPDPRDELDAAARRKARE